MKILVWLITASLQIIFLKLNLLDKALPWAERFHELCVHFIQRIPSSWNWFYAAILVGEQKGLRLHSEITALTTLGLYHLMVVSGAHIRAFEQVTKAATFFLNPRLQKIIVGLTLLLILIANRFSPPCLRAMIVWGLGVFPIRLRPRSTLDIQILAAFLCLCIEPQWAYSLSYQLTCVASMAIATSSTLWRSYSVLAQHLLTGLLCTLSTMPLILGIQGCISWLVVPACVAALPIFEFLVMPISGLNSFFPSIRFVTTPILDWIFDFAKFVSHHASPYFCSGEVTLKGWGIIYIGFYYLVCIWLWPYLKRQEFKKAQEG